VYAGLDSRITPLDNAISYSQPNLLKRASSSRFLTAGPSSVRAFQGVVIFSLLVRLIALFAARYAPLAADARDYTDMARQLASGQSFVPYWPPGVPLFLEPFVAAGASDAMLRALILIFWLIACWGLYRLMRATQTQGAAWLVLLVFSLLPDSIQMSIEPMTQMPMAALLIVMLSSAVKAVRGAPPVEYLLLGTSLGIMSLIRPSAAPLIILVPLACALASRRYLPALASAMLGISLIGCWMVHAHAFTGRWIINTANGVNIYNGNNPWTPPYRTWYFGSHAKPGSAESVNFPEFEQVLHDVYSLPVLDQSAQFQHLAVTYIREHPGMFLYRTANRVRCFFGFDTFTSAALSGNTWMRVRIFPVVLLCEMLIYLLIAGSAIFWIAQAPRSFWHDPANWILLGTIVLYAAPYWISMSHPTYHFPILLPLAALGVIAWKASVHETARSTRGWIALAALGLVQAEWVWQMSGAVVSHAQKTNF
jgi:4-amino-4-deoxy-L-arabinose transferase-like glycosyltransferase